MLSCHSLCPNLVSLILLSTLLCPWTWWLHCWWHFYWTTLSREVNKNEECIHGRELKTLPRMPHCNLNIRCQRNWRGVAVGWSDWESNTLDINKKVLQIMKKTINVHCNIVITSNIKLEKALNYSLCLESFIVTFTCQSNCLLKIIMYLNI